MAKWAKPAAVVPAALRTLMQQHYEREADDMAAQLADARARLGEDDFRHVEQALTAQRDYYATYARQLAAGDAVTFAGWQVRRFGVELPGVPRGTRIRVEPDGRLTPDTKTVGGRR